MPLDSDYKMIGGVEFQRFNYAVFRADGGHAQVISDTAYGLMMAGIALLLQRIPGCCSQPRSGSNVDRMGVDHIPARSYG